MTTYNANVFSATRITTDLELYFELTNHIYTQDPEFSERWNEYIIDMVKDRLWGYSKAVMATELGEEIYGGSIDRRDDDEECGEHTLREAFVAFAKSNVEFGEPRPYVWNTGYECWEEVEEEEEAIGK
jgi:hypothetical protein